MRQINAVPMWVGALVLRMAATADGIRRMPAFADRRAGTAQVLRMPGGYRASLRG